MTYRMHLDPSPFALIASGRKTVELRLYDERRRPIKPGDHILFYLDDPSKNLLCRVDALHVFPSFKGLYDAIPHEKLGYMPGTAAHSDDMRRYYSEEAEKTWGAVGIEISLLH